MTRVVTRELVHRFRDQHGVISRSQLNALGVSSRALRHRLATGEWEQVGHRAVRLAGSRATPEQDLLAQCLAAGPAAVASHQSAAWLWRVADVPERHAVTLPRSVSGRRLTCDVHRPIDFPLRIAMVANIPCTDPLRTIVDAAAVMTSGDLELLVDRALARRIVTLEGIDAELERSSRKGKHGLRALRSALKWRRSIGAAQPSVLEAMTLRLLKQAGIKPVGVEVKASTEHSYRVDIMLRPGLGLEVDGYAYHRSPEQMAEDARRRNRLYLGGTQVLVYTWRDVDHDGARLVFEVRKALSQWERSHPHVVAGRAPT
ncbi:MAG TPA: type IV toxin-antitoxin system AbiEi family antitoxin domain-containing protein [Acidimicrobiales bacterium]|nr:type IV toxin-antitoxin system AbiEi family antitoxin domain-containing protein [Acidimicrobiales bacterium]